MSDLENHIESEFEIFSNEIENNETLFKDKLGIDVGGDYNNKSVVAKELSEFAHKLSKDYIKYSTDVDLDAAEKALRNVLGSDASVIDDMGSEQKESFIKFLFTPMSEKAPGIMKAADDPSFKSKTIDDQNVYINPNDISGSIASASGKTMEYVEVDAQIYTPDTKDAPGLG